MTSGVLKIKYLEEQFETLTFLGASETKGVFLCKDKRNGKIVVKKNVSPSTCAVYEKLRTISNPHIAKVYETAFDEKTGIVIEEFINGVTLRDFIRLHGLPDHKNLCQIGCDICDALSEPHALGIIHRDINPDNIMISNDGVLKIIDFGIARTLKRGSPQDTALLGTPGYAPPEQFGFAQTDARTDIYSVGIVISELLLGKLLPVDLLRKQNNGLSFEPVIRKCIEIDPKQRYQTISDLRQAITALNFSASGTGDGKEYRQDRSDGAVISWLPGFRTGKLWKNIVAISGYLFLILSTFAMMTAENYAASAETFLLELFAVFLYLWVATLVALNIGNWDRKIVPFNKFPHSLMIFIRFILWMVLFYAGGLLEHYIKYTMMGLTPVK